jgi:hypothetical protein
MSPFGEAGGEGGAILASSSPVGVGTDRGRYCCLPRIPAFDLGEEAADERSDGSNGGGERLRTGKASPKAVVGGERVERRVLQVGM